jgi:hypothetical protein
MAANAFPGGVDLKSGIEGLVKMNADPSDDLDEGVAAVALIAIGGLSVAEELSNRDLLDNADFKALVLNVQRDIKLFRKVFMPSPAVSTTGSTVSILD